jgi:hypothetical protein
MCIHVIGRAVSDDFVNGRLLLPVLEAFGTLDNTVFDKRLQRFLDAPHTASRFIGYCLDFERTFPRSNIHVRADDSEHHFVAHGKPSIPHDFVVYARKPEIGRITPFESNGIACLSGVHFTTSLYFQKQ